MIRCLEFLVFLLCACTSIQPTPVLELEPQTEIVGTVAVATANYQPHCTGVAIAPKIVITAAHCLMHFAPFIGVSFSMKARDLLVMSGHRDIIHAPPSSFSRVTSIRLHPMFPNYESDRNYDGMGRWDDIAVLTLKDPVQVRWVPILPLSLVDEVLKQGTIVHIAGYGQRGILFEDQTPYQYRTDHEIWIGGSGLPDYCQGDSGGPTMVRMDGYLYLVGATSRGAPWQKTPCGEGGISTLVPAYEGWIFKKPKAKRRPVGQEIGYFLMFPGLGFLGWAAKRRIAKQRVYRV